MKAYKFTGLFLIPILVFGIHGKMNAQCGVYARDLITPIYCTSWACFDTKMESIGFTYQPDFSDEGENATYECNQTNEDGERDLVSCYLKEDAKGKFAQIIFGTDRYYTYNALTTGFFINSFIKYSGDSLNSAGATQINYYSTLYPGVIMYTQVFPTSPEGPLPQYMICLLYYYKD